MIIGTRPLVIIESPFGNPTRLLQIRNKHYLAAAMRDSWDAHEMPFASHHTFPLFLNENNKHDRKEGIEAGFAWWEHATLIAVYQDLGISKGMSAAIERAKAQNYNLVFRSIPDWIGV